MEEWGNLNKYSQQGWESLNALIKAFFFRRTNRGGGQRGQEQAHADRLRDNGADLEEEEIDNDIH
eukprot:scaffold28222_cov63-Attheya_sp.AAC.3